MPFSLLKYSLVSKDLEHIFCFSTIHSSMPSISSLRKPMLNIVIQIGIICFLLSSLAEACQVPVFRYALERWKNDPYQIFVIAEGDLEKEAKEAFDLLRGLEVDEATPANVLVEAINLKDDRDAETFRKHLKEKSLSLPAIFVYYPDDRLTYPPIWAGKATIQNANAIVDSPIRREVLSRILKGDSAVWLMVESGKREVDDTAFSKMGEYLKVAEKELELPEGVIGAARAREALALGQFIDETNVLDSEIELKLSFSRLRMSRESASELPFLEMLMHMESDLKDLKDQPMFFPIFGKARALEPLIGDGIDEDNVLDYCSYITGACSCEVKKQNPGIDLLTRLNWISAIEGSEVVLEKLLPPMEGVAVVLGQDERDQAESITFEAAIAPEVVVGEYKPAEKESGETPLPWLFVIIGFVGVLLVGSLLSGKKN